MKKILSLILALLMSASAASMIGAAEEAAIADDAAVVETEAAPAAAETSQYDEAIAFLHSYGIYKGKSATDLAAADPIERYQMALFVARISTGWVDDAQWASSTWVADQWYDRDHDTSGFDDLEGTPAVNYLGALSYASQKGIIEGYGNKKFGPTDGITYQNALTMIVRTLGYTNLAWPWGYIEKAVTLGLTVGIPSSVKYTDELNRGEVAQLIYNALFIPTKEGDTLAARNFNGELGWETIIITVAGRGRYLTDAKLGDQGYPTDAGKDIGFNVVKEDGTLEPTTYYVKNDDPVSFNFANHEERYLGYAYKALFNKDENSNYVTLISVKSLKADEVWNFGLPTKGEDGKYPITTYLAGKKVVSKFSKHTYLNTVGVQLNGEYTIDNARNNEFILKNALQGGTVQVDAGRMYAIDWITGNILKLNADDKGVIALPAKDVSGKDVSKLDGIERKYTYDVAWYYNDTLNQYFRFKTVDKNGEIQFVGIDIMDPADLQSIIDNQMLKKDQTVKAGLADTGISNTAYASLVSFNLPGYTAPNYGLYEEYRFGQYTEGKVKLNDHEVDGSMIIKSLDAVAKPMYEEVTGKDDFKSGTVSFIKEGACKHNHAIGFFSEDGLTPSVGDYIIYSADKATGEVKVVKIIYDASNEKADKDNFVATGVVRAYNTTEGVTTVTIGETKYSYNYNDLLGNPFGYAVSTDKTWGPLYRAAFSRYFKSLFNQYVKYVVVDGKLVWVERANASNQLIVVDSYAGLSSDGYIVINGYKTDDLKYAQFRIGSYNGWVKGDYYYYLTAEKVEDSFTRGSLYRITSYDKNADVYYVYTVGKDFKTEGGTPAKDPDTGYILHYHDKDGNIVEVKTDTYEYLSYNVDGLGWKYQKLDFVDGYRSVDGSTSYEKTNAKDTYVLICNPIDDDTRPNSDWTGTNKSYPTGGDYAPIIVYTGRVTAKWHVEGFRVTGTGDNSYVFVGVDFNKIVGFDADQYDISYVLFLHYDYTKAAYDSADADGWYLLGASNFEATVFNWYNGEIETKTAVNKDLKMGYSYPSINGVIVNDAPYAAWELDAEIPGAYQWQWEIGSRVTPHYLFGCSNEIVDYAGFAGLDSEDGDTYKAAFKKYFDKENFSKEVISNQKGLTIKVKDLVNSIKVFLVEADADVEKIIEVERVDAGVLSKWAREGKIDLDKLYFWWIMDKDGNVVVYIDRNSGKIAPTVEDVYDTFATAETIVISSGAEKFRSTNFNWFGTRTDTKADIDTAAIKAGLYGKLDEDENPVNITKITLEWGSDLDAGTANLAKLGHHEIDVKDFHFGRKGYCEKENFYIRITDADGKIVRAYDYEDEDTNCIITKMYDAQAHDETECDLIQALEIPVGTIKVNYPEIDDYLGEVTFEEVTEDLIKFLCGGGCACTVEGDSELFNIIEDGYTTDEYALTEEAAEAVVERINGMSTAAETTFTVEFRDSSDTEYLFEITVYVKALFKAVVDEYGHWTVGFDKYIIGADITKAEVKGQDYKFNTTQPEYKDRYVGKDNRADAALPAFDKVVDFIYTY